MEKQPFKEAICIECNECSAKCKNWLKKTEGIQRALDKGKDIQDIISEGLHYCPSTGEGVVWRFAGWMSETTCLMCINHVEPCKSCGENLENFTLDESDLETEKPKKPEPNLDCYWCAKKPPYLCQHPKSGMRINMGHFWHRQCRWQIQDGKCPLEDKITQEIEMQRKRWNGESIEQDLQRHGYGYHEPNDIR